MAGRKLKIIPLGGLGEIGRNMTLLEYGNNIIVIDVGVKFPTAEQYGIDLVIPDWHYLRERREHVRGIVLTHGHEDHIGALPFLLRDGFHDVPIYATRLTSMTSPFTRFAPVSLFALDRLKSNRYMWLTVSPMQ